MLILASGFYSLPYLHFFNINFFKESYLFLIIGTLFFLILNYIFRIRQIKSSKRKLSFLVEKRTKLISTQKEEIENQNKRIKLEKDKSDQLLLNVLPDHVVKELKQEGKVSIKKFVNSSVMFIDIVGFSHIAENYKPEYLVNKLNNLFTDFDEIIEKYHLEKIKTIGDAYLATGGLGLDTKTNAIKCVLAALEIQTLMENYKQQAIAKDNEYWSVRIGIHTGEVITGLLGVKRIAYDIFGSTVNIAERMQANCEPWKVNISEATYQQVKIFFNCSDRGKVATKNTGKINMFFVNSLKYMYKNSDDKFANNWLMEILDFYSKSSLNYFALKSFVTNFLDEKLSSNLHYHGRNHTEYVLAAAAEICYHEKVTPEEFFILKTAVLFHDMGYIDQYEDNESIGVNYAKNILPKYGYTDLQIKTISKLILSTKVPQKPKNILEKVICDADLDYLGREDFLKISDDFYKELKGYKYVQNKLQWDKIQIDFLKKHTYFTDFSIKNRTSLKNKHLKIIENRIK